MFFYKIQISGNIFLNLSHIKCKHVKITSNFSFLLHYCLKMETLSSSKFHMCPETSRNALINKRNNKQKLVQLPEAIYRSLLPHAQSLSSFVSLHRSCFQ